MRSSSKIALLVCVLALLVVCALAEGEKVTVPAQGRPLKNLTKQADGHYTPYTLPAYPETAKVYTVKTGDTLWDLARTNLNNPYLWPQIWEQNPYITNPHWIYPGDPLLIEEPKLVEQPTVSEEAAKEPEEAPLGALQKKLPQPDARSAPLDIVTKELETYYCTDVELYGSGRISAKKLSFDTFIVGAEDEQLERLYSPGEIVYLNKGMRQNVFPGSRFQVLRSGGEVKNPVTGKFVGFYYMELGLVKVLIAHDDNAIAEVELATRPIYCGDALLPFTEKQKLPRDQNHKLQRFVEDNGKPSGNIVFMEDDRTIAGAGAVVYIDLGEKADIAPGQICTVYRIEGDYHQTNEFYPDHQTENVKAKPVKEFKLASKNALAHRSIPRVILGELVVLEVFDCAAKALIIESRQFMNVRNFVQAQ